MRGTGKRLKEIRLHLGLTQADFGEKVGLKQSQIRDIESEKQKVSVELSEIIEKIFNINGWWLLTGKGSMYLEDEQKSIGDHNNIVSVNGSINGNITINTNLFNHSEDIKEIVELLQYAPSSFLQQIKDRLKKFKELSQI